MEELFRHLFVRPADEPDKDLVASRANDLRDDSAFQKSLYDIADQSARRALARSYIEGPDFIGDPSRAPFADVFLGFAERFESQPLDRLESRAGLRSDFAARIREADPDVPDLGDPSGYPAWFDAFVERADLRRARRNLANSIVALREGATDTRHMHKLAAVHRAIVLAERLRADAPTEIAAAAALNATLFLSDRPPRLRAGYRDDDIADSGDDDDGAAGSTRRLGAAINELMNLPLTQIRTERVVEVGGADDPAGGRAGGDDLAGFGRVTARAMMSRTALERIRPETLETMRALGLDPEDETVDAMIEAAQATQAARSVALFRAAGRFDKGTMVPLPSPGGKYGTAPPDEFEDWIPAVPEKSGDVRPSGIGDLLVVRQQLKAYRGGDIAHVENILKGERKERVHRRRDLSDVTSEEEIETESVSEQESQTTTRFELRSEVQKQLSEDLAVDAGVNVSASYGPVSVETSTKFAYKNARSESRSRAVGQSRETVDKAAARYTERVRETLTRRIVNEVEETNTHAIDATGASAHVVGMYQWLDKVYEAQLFNYGLRVMYEFMIPEPAAYYIWSLVRRTANTDSLHVPPPFDITPQDVNEHVYQELAARYEAAEVSPPPEPFITVSVQKTGGPNPEKGPFVDNDVATIPEGYEFLTYAADYGITRKSSDDTFGFSVEVPSFFPHPGSVPVLFHGYSLTGWTAYVQIICRRTQTAFEDWRLRVWDALQEGHRRQVADYEEKLAALLVQEGVTISGRNPLANRAAERTELRKACVSVLAATAPTWLNGIIDTVSGPKINYEAATKQGAYVRFFEHAYEWENMAYLFYPYFWARAKLWPTLAGVEDVDPSFRDFLAAGYARVVVPVRPGFEAAVEHFRQTGQVWSGGKLPEITDEDYLPIALELKARQGAPGSEEPVGEPWEVVVPTQLVRLRPGDDLPRWEKDENGVWHES